MLLEYVLANHAPLGHRSWHAVTNVPIHITDPYPPFISPFFSFFCFFVLFSQSSFILCLFALLILHYSFFNVSSLDLTFFFFFFSNDVLWCHITRTPSPHLCNRGWEQQKRHRFMWWEKRMEHFRKKKEKKKSSNKLRMNWVLEHKRLGLLSPAENNMAREVGRWAIHISPVYIYSMSHSLKSRLINTQYMTI